MKENPQFYNVSLLPDTYYRFFEVGVGHFITHGGSLNYASTYDFEKYSGMLAGAPDPSSNTAKIRSPQGIYYVHAIQFYTLNILFKPGLLHFKGRLLL